MKLSLSRRHSPHLDQEPIQQMLGASTYCLIFWTPDFRTFFFFLFFSFLIESNVKNLLRRIFFFFSELKPDEFPAQVKTWKQECRAGSQNQETACAPSENAQAGGWEGHECGLGGCSSLLIFSSHKRGNGPRERYELA